MKKKPLTNAERTRRSVARYKDAGLQHSKVWVHPDEASELRQVASEMPLTSKILKQLRG